MLVAMHRSSNIAFPKSIVGQACAVVFSACFLSLAGCGAGGEEGPTISTTATPAGAVARLDWTPVVPLPGEPPILGYYIHYGKGSPGQAGSCSYEDVKFVNTPSGTVTGLDMDSRYYFAVSAYNGVEGACSNEVSTNT